MVGGSIYKHWSVWCVVCWQFVREVRGVPSVHKRETALWSLYWAWWVQTGYPTLPLIASPPSRPPSAQPPPRHERRGSKILCQPVQVVVWAKWKHFWINELSFRMSHNSVTEVSEITGVSTLHSPCWTTSIGTTRFPTRIVCYIRILQLIV